jgi:hypothetical protein
MPTDTLPVTGQDIALAAVAVRGLLDQVLERESTTFEPWLLLNLIATRGPTLERTTLVQTVTSGTRGNPDAIRQALTRLEALGLVREASTGAEGAVELSSDGVARHAHLRDAVGHLTTELYAPFDATDLAITRRVLNQLTERANARLVAAVSTV